MFGVDKGWFPVAGGQAVVHQNFFPLSGPPDPEAKDTGVTLPAAAPTPSVVGSVEALVGWNHSVKESFGGSKDSQTCHQPSVACKGKITVKCV